MNKKFSLLALVLGFFLIAPSTLTGQDILIQVYLFQGSWMEGQPGLKQVEILSAASHPEIASIKNKADGTESDLKAAVTEILLKIHDLQTVQDLFSFVMFWNGKDAALSEPIVQPPNAFRFVLNPAPGFAQFFTLKTAVYFKEAKAASAGGTSADKERLKELWAAVGPSNYEKQMEKILDLEITLGIEDPAIVGFPCKDRTFFMMIMPTERPQPVRQVMPAYPEELRQQGVKGKATFRISINEEGTVRDVRVVKPLQPYLDSAACLALKQWTFEPVLIKGKSAPVSFNWIINFDPEKWGPIETKAANPAEAPSPKLQKILDGCAEYCRKLADAALDFICEETIKDTNYDLYIPREMKTTAPKESVRQTDGSTFITVISPRASSLPPNPYKTKTNRYVCDYQMVKKGNRIEERRVIIKENGRSAIEGKKMLEEKRFHVLRPLFASVAILDRDRQSLFSYRLLGDDRIQGKNACVIEAIPRIGAPGGVQSAKIWADQATYQILQSETQGIPVEGYEFILNEAAQIGKDPLFTMISTYQVERNGVLFPGRSSVLVEYPVNLWGRSKRTKLETEIRYDKYKFFTVETKPEIIK